MSFIRSVSLAAALAVGVASAVAAQPPAAPRSPAPRADARPGRGTARPPRPPRQRAGQALLRGITLSDTQRGQVQAIHRKYGREMAALRAPLTAERRGQARGDSAGRAAMRQRMQTDSARRGMRAQMRPDSAARETMRRQLAEVRDRSRALREQELTEVRAMLTAEQQRTFDANRKQLGDRAAEWRQRRGPAAGPGARGSRGAGRGRAGGTPIR